MTQTDIDALARLLDGDPTLNGEATAETRALGVVAHYLTQTRPVSVRPEFKAALREQLVEAARTQSPAAAPSLLGRLRASAGATAGRLRTSARAAAATASAALVLSSGGMAVAADRALPDDMLYPAKLVMEDVRIAFVRDPTDRGEAKLSQATHRIAEAEAVAADGNQPAAARALVEADDSARRGAGALLRAYQEEGDDEAVERLTEFTDEQRVRLGGLDQLLDGAAVEAAEALSIGLERIEARLLSMTGACEACEGGMPGAGAGFDFTHIPSSRELFRDCPCELGTSGEPTTPVDPADEPEPAPDPKPEPPPEVVEEPPPPVEQPPVLLPLPQPPAEDEPTTTPPPEPPRPLLEVGDAGETIIEQVLDSVFDLLGQ